MKIGILFRARSVWMGVHYSPYARRYCVNLLPFVTIWIMLKGGRIPGTYKREEIAVEKYRRTLRKILADGKLYDNPRLSEAYREFVIGNCEKALRWDAPETGEI